MFLLDGYDSCKNCSTKLTHFGQSTVHHVRPVELLISGVAVKICLYDESNHLPVHSEDKVFYIEEDYRDFLARRGWTSLREFDGYRNIDNIDDLRSGALYRRNIDNMDDLRPGAIYRGVS